LTSVSVASPGQRSILDDDLSSAVILSESRGDSILHSLSTSSHSMDEVCFPHDIVFGNYKKKPHRFIVLSLRSTNSQPKDPHGDASKM